MDACPLSNEPLPASQALVATVRGFDEEMRLVDQIARGIGRVRLIRFLVRGKQILREFAAGKRIEEFLRVVKPRAKFADDLDRDRDEISGIRV